MKEKVVCQWCGEEILQEEARCESDFGWLCDRCARAIKSRGEKLCFVDAKPKKIINKNKLN